MPVGHDALWGWAKTNRLAPADSAFAWASLADHGCDVAAVFRALVDGPFRRPVAAVFGRMDEGVAAALEGLAGLHDCRTDHVFPRNSTICSAL